MISSDGNRLSNDALSRAAKGERDGSSVGMGEMLNDDELDQLCDKVIEELNDRPLAG